MYTWQWKGRHRLPTRVLLSCRYDGDDDLDDVDPDALGDLAEQSEDDFLEQGPSPESQQAAADEGDDVSLDADDC